MAPFRFQAKRCGQGGYPIHADIYYRRSKLRGHSPREPDIAWRPDVDDVNAAHDEATSLGARLLKSTDDIRSATGRQVHAAPTGHPFCMCSADDPATGAGRLSSGRGHVEP
jgi:Glyoxalase-like domain